MKILITGGAGYIGSHAVLKACQENFEVVIIDNLFRGYKECIDTLQKLFPNKITFYNIDIREKQDLKNILEKERDIKAVMHFAALLSVGESMQIPYLYFQNNTYGTLNLLECMNDAGIKNLVFSSTCASYANIVNENPADLSKYAIDENQLQKPESVYGESKFLSEKEIIWFGKLFQMNYMILRYFNVCGSNSDTIIGYSTKPSMALIQNALRGALGIEPFKFTYSNVPTPDGSPIRDYINVEDLVDAHFLALEKMLNSNVSQIYNLGTGNGSSVKKVVNKVMEVTGKNFDVEKAEARPGEAIALFANTNKIKTELGWEPKRSLEDSIHSLVKWYTKRPNGWEY